MLIGVDTNPLCCLTTKQEFVQLQNDIKIVRTLRLFIHRKLVFSLLSIPILVMVINSGSFSAICRVCLLIDLEVIVPNFCSAFVAFLLSGDFFSDFLSFV